jgi:hypothetical protein
MLVSATVLARAVVSVAGAPATIDVTADDLARGYVDAGPVTVRVKTNSRRGYLLQANNIGDVFSRIELTNAALAMDVVQESWIERPYVAGGDVVTFRARLHLAAGASAGTYAVPVAFSASPR